VLEACVTISEVLTKSQRKYEQERDELSYIAPDRGLIARKPTTVHILSGHEEIPEEGYKPDLLEEKLHEEPE